MHVPVLFHRTNDWLCFVVGSLTNGSLLWLIAYRTEVEGRPYRPILLLATLVDLAYLAVYALVVPVLTIDGGLAAIISVGPLGWVPQPYNFALAAAWIFFFIFSLCSICVPFLYRYSKICLEKHNYGLREFLWMLAVPTLLTLSYVATCFYAGYPWTEEDQQRGREHFFNESSAATYVISYIAMDELRNRVVSAYATLLVAANYTVVFTCGWRIYSKMRQETAENLSEEHARELNQQVGRALLLQALVPLVVETLPTLVTCVGTLAGMQVNHLAIYVTAVLAWTPVVNPLIPMWVVGAYRREVRKWWSGQFTSTGTPLVILFNQQHQQMGRVGEGRALVEEGSRRAWKSFEVPPRAAEQRAKPSAN